MIAEKIKFDVFFNEVVKNNVEKKGDDFIVRFCYEHKSGRSFANFFTYSLEEYHRYNGFRFPKFETKEEKFKAHIKRVVCLLQKDDNLLCVCAPVTKDRIKQNEIYYNVIID